MFDSVKARTCIKKIKGWSDFHDTSLIPELSAGLKESESGEYYQEAHPALRLDRIKAVLPDGMDLEGYLNKVEDSAITELLNDLSEKKTILRAGKELIDNEVIYNSEAFVNDVVMNESRFVGVRFKTNHLIGLKATINRFALQLTAAQNDLTVYLYHSNKAKAITKFEYTTTQGGQFNWIEVFQDLNADEADLTGGVFFLGYYQDDLTGQAVGHTKLNWTTGFCSGCDGGVNQKRFKGISAYVSMQSIYVPNPSLAVDHDFIFDTESVIEEDINNWGFNFNISVACDLTNFWCDNRKMLRNALTLKVVEKILTEIKYSDEINYVEESLKSIIIRDLEGDKETNYVNIPSRYSRALKSVNINHSAINKVCLPEAVSSTVSYDAM